MISNNIVVVANRLPVTWTRADDGEPEVTLAPGGLVSALTPVAEQLQCVWVGWHDGGASTSSNVNGIELVTVTAESDVYDQYYHGFANQVLWPVFHGLSEYAPDASAAEEQHSWWRAYQRMNRAFADRVSEVAHCGSLIWIHDYHLLLVPGLLRTLRPDLRIVVFLHIPFPELRHLEPWPWARELIRGLGASALIGVQREQDARRLRAAQGVFAEDSSTLIDVFPISIDVQPFLDDARLTFSGPKDMTLRNQLGVGARPILLSVERLDYTKGIVERIEAFAEVLHGWEDLESRPVLVQVLTPTREGVPAYREYGDRVRAAVNRLSERFATKDYSPIITLEEPRSAHELVELYLAADVMCVTPIRDGMNLVAKEYVVSRIDEQGVLVLSREAGAADELVEALTVDPLDPQELVMTLRQAFKLDSEEARIRMHALRSRVLHHDVHRWAERFLAAANKGTMFDGSAFEPQHATSREGTVR